MSADLSRLEPKSLWKQFAAILSIPRPSGHEQAVSDYVRKVAGEADLEVVADATGNLLVRVPATPGREGAPVIVMQNHLDMVGEKNKDVTHDFTSDPIRAGIEGEWVTADGTTLGADNGVGAAAALAVALDPDVEHGPLELLFTVDEESGLTGAKGLDASMITGRTMLNLDSEEDGVVYVGCAGGCDIHLTVTPSWAEPPAGLSPLALEVTGLSGGHSGLNIGENRGNAVKLLVRLLQAAIDDGVDLHLANLSGGDKHNAIPREAEATVLVDDAGRHRLKALLARMLEEFRGELRGVDDSLEIAAAPGQPPKRSMVEADRNRLLQLLAALPHGVLAMSNDLEGLVETSSNLAAIQPRGDSYLILTSSRSSVMSSLDAVLLSIRSIGALAGADVDVQVGYPGWKPNMDSSVLKVVRGVYSRLWERDPEITAIHAGLECGLIGEKVPGMDMVSFGPQIQGAHSPDERVNVPSVARFWNALKEVLGELSDR